MQELQIFNSPEFGQIRTIDRGGEPWFVGKGQVYFVDLFLSGKAGKEWVR